MHYAKSDVILIFMRSYSPLAHPRVTSHLLVVVALIFLAQVSVAAPAITFTATTTEAIYSLRSLINVTCAIDNTTAVAAGGTTPGADAAANAANTALNVRVSKVALLGTDIYGNSVTICSSSYPAPAVNVNQLSYSVPDVRGNLGPGTAIAYSFSITIPNDGTLHDIIFPGYRVEVTLEWDIPAPAGGIGSITRTTDANILIGVTPNLELPSVTCPPNPKQFRGGDVVRFNSFVLNSLTGDGTRQSRPMRSVEGDIFRVSTHLTTDPAYGSTTPNNDDYELYFTDILGDLGEESAPDGQSTIRTVRVFDTP